MTPYDGIANLLFCELHTFLLLSIDSYLLKFHVLFAVLLDFSKLPYIYRIKTYFLPKIKNGYPILLLFSKFIRMNDLELMKEN